MELEERTRFSIGMLDLVQQVLAGKVDPPAAADRLRRAATWLEQLGTEEKPAESILGKPTQGDIERVFAHWQRATNRPRAKLDAERKSMIRARLKDFVASDLCRAIDAMASDPFASGTNDRDTRYDWLKHALRDNPTLERWLEQAAPAVVAATGEVVDDAIRDLQEQADRAMRDGDIEEYHALNERIRNHGTA